MYQVRWIERITRNGEEQGGDDNFLKEFKRLREAKLFGEKVSHKSTIEGKPLHEIWITMYDENTDTKYDWFISKGIITHIMNG